MSQQQMSIDENVVLENIETFCLKYFQANNKHIVNERAALTRFATMKKPRIQFLRIYRFLTVAIDQLKNIDPSFLNSQFSKFHDNVNEDIAKYKDIVAKNKDIDFICHHEYLEKYNKFYISLIERTEATKQTQLDNTKLIDSLGKQLDEMRKKNIDPDSARFKAINKQFADALTSVDKGKTVVESLLQKQELYKEAVTELFSSAFPTHLESTKKETLQLLNLKIFLLNRTLWALAKKSTIIKNHFSKLIDSDLSLITYIRFFFESSNSKTLAPAERSYLQSCIAELQKYEEFMRKAKQMS